ncbi:hypothetical protein BYT27DRAFT_6636900 [Phlegmacium glaucopus]|nr:hypothetical protein BYT27DRAFT_6636900 [Phlegmacium glaucopus]
MQGRPPSSARPSTSARPTTAFDRDQFQHRLQPQPYEVDEEYEEESDDEDVFAFLPPTTADQEQQHGSQSPFTTLHSNGVRYPEPAFDPWGRQYPTVPAPAPAPASSKNPFSVSITDPNAQSYPYTTSPPHATSPPPGIHAVPPHPYPYNQPPPSPSTDSHPSTGMTGPDLYRLKRLGTAVSSKLGVSEEGEENDDEKRKEQEPSANDAKKEEEQRVERDVNDSDDKEGYDSDTATSEKDMDNNNITSRRRSTQRRRTVDSQNFQHENPHNADTERDAGLHRRSIADTIASVSKSKRGSRISEGGGIIPNQNAMPYKMYNQQASSYYGRDVRTGGASGRQNPSHTRPRSISPSGQSSSFQHGAGPSHSHSQSISQSQSYHQHYDQQHHGILAMPQAASSLADSLSMTQSMMEDDESRSIKLLFLSLSWRLAAAVLTCDCLTFIIPNVLLCGVSIFLFFCSYLSGYERWTYPEASF